MSDAHAFNGTLTWLGQPAGRPFTYETIARDTRLAFEGGAQIEGSAPGVFGGDDSKLNPETLMMASLMQCHFLTFMAVAAKSRIEVTRYADAAVGTLGKNANGKMAFAQVVLRPRVRLASPLEVEKFVALHDKAHANCFMANSVNFEVRVEPELE
ncbi:MAG: OsmC family protein [Rhodocyclaceae bacterium]